MPALACDRLGLAAAEVGVHLALRARQVGLVERTTAGRGGERLEDRARLGLRPVLGLGLAVREHSLPRSPEAEEDSLDPRAPEARSHASRLDVGALAVRQHHDDALPRLG